MKKKLIGILFVLTLVILTTLCGTVSANRINYVFEISEELFYHINSDENETNILTLGPISPFFNITEITLINGSSSEIKKIERLLNSRLLQLIHPLTYIECNDLDFTVSYIKNVPFFIPIIRHLSYFTTLYVGLNFPFNNKTIWGKKHIIIVEGFDGYFGFQRLRPWKVAPTLFCFSGSYKDITIIK